MGEVCNICFKNCSSFKKLKKHFIKKHTSIMLIECCFCDFVTGDESIFGTHKTNTHPEDKLACELCKFTTRRWSRLKKHFSHHQRKNQVVACDVGSKLVEQAAATPPGQRKLSKTSAPTNLLFEKSKHAKLETKTTLPATNDDPLQQEIHVKWPKDFQQRSLPRKDAKTANSFVDVQTGFSPETSALTNLLFEKSKHAKLETKTTLPATNDDPLQQEIHVKWPKDFQQRSLPRKDAKTANSFVDVQTGFSPETSALTNLLFEKSKHAKLETKTTLPATNDDPLQQEIHVKWPKDFQQRSLPRKDAKTANSFVDVQTGFSPETSALTNLLFEKSKHAKLETKTTLPATNDDPLQQEIHVKWPKDFQQRSLPRKDTKTANSFVDVQTGFSPETSALTNLLFEKSKHAELETKTTLPATNDDPLQQEIHVKWPKDFQQRSLPRKDTKTANSFVDVQTGFSPETSALTNLLFEKSKHAELETKTTLPATNDDPLQQEIHVKWPKDFQQRSLPRKDTKTANSFVDVQTGFSPETSALTNLLFEKSKHAELETKTTLPATNDDPLQQEIHVKWPKDFQQRSLPRKDTKTANSFVDVQTGFSPETSALTNLLFEKSKHAELETKTTLPATNDDPLQQEIHVKWPKDFQQRSLPRKDTKTANSFVDVQTGFSPETSALTNLLFEKSKHAELETKTTLPATNDDPLQQEIHVKWPKDFQQRSLPRKDTKTASSFVDVQRGFSPETNLDVSLDDKIKPFPCYECGKFYTTERILKSHVESKHIQRRLYTCDQCDFSTFHRTAMYPHKKIHKDREFNCAICGNSFTLLQTLNNHMLTHSGKKPFSCFICDCHFTQRGSLIRHNRNVHHNNEIP
ncbi:uncharacterized protein LOC131952276 [Physella acuta]|uniref:uncharacterized protein LOC131952276 n=1 Tax=Physella acuta TaxID=109671 RepID=UPI0027DCEFBE|nr:uncharacterized protein LOC131952276 [Physella acuta]XP_059170859.1 uncharacterized protein LOC131952276 [Physella acuta]